MSKNFNIPLPKDVDGAITLGGDIVDKHTTDGASSPLNNQPNIDMTVVTTLFDFALQKHLQGKKKDRDKEDAIQQRNIFLGLHSTQNSYTEGTVLFLVSSLRDDLVGIFRGEEKRLGGWGYEVNERSKRPTIVIPRVPHRLVQLGEDIIEKHTADGASSLLNDDKVTALQSLLALAQAQLKLARKLQKERKSLFQERNRALGWSKKQNSKTKGTMYFYFCCIRDVLLGNFRGNEMQLGLWGFQVQFTSLPTNPDPDPEPTDAILSGKVLDAVSQEFLGGVAVQFLTSNGVVTSNSTAIGDYTAVLPLGAGELITVQINHPGYQPFNEQHFVSPGDELVFDFNLQPV